MLAFISWIVFGLIVGALARLVLSGSDPMSLIATMLLGVAGSIAGGFIGSLFMGSGNTGFQPAGFFFSVVGATLLLLLVRKIRGTTTVG
jgi:uncharacterized membrane protein YeaQ/YmgE (transglycosylase-associated protein family)